MSYRLQFGGLELVTCRFVAAPLQHPSIQICLVLEMRSLSIRLIFVNVVAVRTCPFAYV